MNSTVSFAFDICLLFVGLYAISRLFHLRTKRASLISKTSNSNRTFLTKALSPLTLSIVIVTTLLIIVKTVLDVRGVISLYSDSALGHLLFMMAFVGSIFLATLFAVRNSLKK
jgi:uncharacterized membrane protein